VAADNYARTYATVTFSYWKKAVSSQYDTMAAIIERTESEEQKQLLYQRRGC
jgi:hypothetical protein